jgi:methylglyoxal synthase
MQNYKKQIGLVAHDERKTDLLEWVKFNADKLRRHQLWATGTTGKVIEKYCQITVNCLKSGPLGGDQQLGAKIANNELDILIFFWDPMAAQPHDVDVKALLRMSVLYNVATACNRTTADFLIASDLFDHKYTPTIKDYSKYLDRIP